MITNIIDQSFADFASKVTTIEKKAVPQRQRLDLLADYYTDRVSANETELIQKYAASLVSGGQPHTPDPRLYMRRDLLGLVQDSYALGIADALVDLEDVQFSYNKTDADFALSPDDKLQRDIAKLQRDIQASQQIIRQTKTLNQYTNTLQTLQNQAQALGNTQATQTLGSLSQQLQTLKTNNTARTAIRVVNQQLQKGGTQQQQAQALVNQQIVATGSPNTQDYLVKRAIEEKLKYLQNRKDSLANTPSVVLDEDTDFFRWYADKRLVPIANRYQQGIVDKNNEAKEIATKYTEEINKGTTTQAAKGTATDKIVRKLLNIEDSSTPSSKDKKRPIKRVQRVVATELAIAYNVGRLKAYLKAGIQYVTISTSQYSDNPCEYCIDTEEKTKRDPISIASLLKRAYRNEGFDKSLNRPVESRYLISHPYCKCIYLPHPKRDPEEKEDSTGIYADPNSWKFILGAGLGVSLVFLAFALTTGRKIAPTIPRTIPTGLPVRVPQAIPEIVSETQPQTVPVRTIKPSELSVLPELQRSIQNLTPTDQLDYARIILDPLLTDGEKATELVKLGKKNRIIFNPEDYKTVEAQVLDVVQKNKGSMRILVNETVQKVVGVYNRNTQALTARIAQEQAKVQAIDPQNPTKSAIDGITNSVKNINKTFITTQLKSIEATKKVVLESYDKVVDKTKSSDLKYKQELQQKLDTLSSMESSLLEQRQVLGDIQEYLNDLVIPTKAAVRKATKAIIQQQLTKTTAAVDRLLDGSVIPTSLDKIRQANYIQEAQQEYQKLLEVIIDLPPKDVGLYQKRVQDLKRRIEKAQGIELKRFTGNIASFARYSLASYKYS